MALGIAMSPVLGESLVLAALALIISSMGLFGLALTLVGVSIQVLRTARADPAEVLRRE